jgi:hypothetical protein
LPQQLLPFLVLLCLVSFLGFPKVLCYSRIPFAVVFIGSTLFALQQLSGINAVFYFSSTVFKSAGVPSNLANVFIGIANLTGIASVRGSPLMVLGLCILTCDSTIFMFSRISYCDGFDG